MECIEGRKKTAGGPWAGEVTPTKLVPKACLHCGKMNPDPIRIQSGSVVSGSDVVRLRPHWNNRKNCSHVRASRAATCT